MTKSRLRAEALARRDALAPAWRIEAALEIAAAAGGLPQAATVAGFWPMRSEVDVRPLMAALADRGARLALPAILDRTTIVFREFLRGAELVPMGFGTFGPGPEAALVEPDLILVPLAAHDGRGHRIGYGGGFYDRAIAALHAAGRRPHLVGVAFSCQEVERVPDEAHDMRLDAVLMEKGLRAFAHGL